MREIISIFVIVFFGVFVNAQGDLYCFVPLEFDENEKVKFIDSFVEAKLDSYFFETLEVEEISNIFLIEKGRNPEYLAENRETILECEYYNLQGDPVIEAYDSLGPYTIYPFHSSPVNFHSVDSIKFLIHIDKKKDILNFEVIGIRLMFNEEKDSNISVLTKDLYYHINDTKFKRTMPNKEIQIDLNYPYFDDFRIEKMSLIYQGNKFEGTFIENYFDKFTMNEILFIDKLGYSSEESVIKLRAVVKDSRIVLSQ